MKIITPFIQLNALLKLLGWVETGGEANSVIDQGQVKVNGKIETRRRNKIYPGAIVELGNNKINIE